MPAFGQERFDNRVAQVALAVFSGVIAFIGLSLVTQGESRVAGVVFLVGGLFFVGRALRSSSVIVDNESVTTKSIVRTRRYLLRDLARVELAVGRSGFAGAGREYLVFHDSKGRAFAFKELSSAPPKSEEDVSVVRRAAQAIGRRLTESSE